jgi:hypothetical protein
MAEVLLTLLLPAFCPQPPNQTSQSCECAYNRTARPSHESRQSLPTCLPTTYCKASGIRSKPSDTTRGAESYVIVYGFNRSLVRYWYKADPFRSYLNAMRLIVRLLLSLQAAASVLPVHLLLSGERHEGFEQALVQQFSQLRLTIADATRHRIRVPRWASAFHWGSFAKLSVLSLTQFRRIVVLDTDAVVLRNIDHLVSLPSPSFVYRFKCWAHKRSNLPIWEMNSGLMVLKPDEALHGRMQALMNGNGTTSKRDSEALKSIYTPSDPSDQSVWRHFFSRVHELPVAYNTFKKTKFVRVMEWDHVYVLHDPDVHRKAKIPRPSVEALYNNLTAEAQLRVQAMAESLQVKNRGRRSR